MNVLGCRCAVKRTPRLCSRQIWTLNRYRILSSAIFRVHEAKTSALPLNSVNVIARHKSDEKDLSLLFQPLPFKAKDNPDDINVGAELTGQIRKENLLRLLNQFYRRKEVKKLAAENGLDNRLFHQAYISFRKFCVDAETLPVDLHVILSDILQEAGHVDDILPYFLRHAREIFPHLECMDDLKKISDLRLPANWYPEARAIERKIVFHAGPTNSGKTYHALQRYLVAKSGIYCGPLKLLATEVYHKSNQAGTPCDLVTGEERRYAADEENPSNHVACTVEMASSVTPYEVAVIDEIQMIKDPQRGWAWTRALLGLCAKEIHVCGEASAIDMVKELMLSTGDEVEVKKYKRLTRLTYLDRALENFDNVRPGDCFVCFSKNDIYHISRQLEKRGHTCAVIYGGLPPGTKLAQAQKFNDPDDPCKVMVATDAIGMGLNLSIKRIIFYSLVKPHLNEKGEKEMDLISTSQALQIGGRAGRFNTQFQDGEVTTFRSDDLQLLKDITSRLIEPIEQAGLHPTAEQIELFAFHLPKATLSNLIDIFVTLCELDNDKYFMCNVDDFKFLADVIEHVPLPLRARYVFCCSPIPKKQPFVCTMFLKFARQFSRGEPLTLDWLCRQVGWPVQAPLTIVDLVHLEGVFDVLDLYLWLSYRFMDMFPDAVHVRDMQQELDKIIQLGVFNITQLLKTSETNISNGPTDDEDDFEIKKRGRRSQRGRLPDTALDLDLNEKPKSLADRFKMAKAVKAAKMPTGKVTEELIKQGLLTPELVDKLQKEWSEQVDQDKSRNGDGNGSLSGGGLRKNPRRR
ncbi:ATP-dependent RNA helicase SUPV3L1, mitochondrial-like [Lineus longissimus]|uniref:ATP-dependent RNA helicase SUPV3L1, mitochondrial-like n=1 Tax=Lineus longissimus TaxID=88925 RepID=UPI002B4D00E5